MATASVSTIPYRKSLAEPEHIAVIGGGMLGLTLAYRLSRAGVRVALYEAANSVGGVMRSTRIGGTEVDGFYHTILSSDGALLALIDEVGLGDDTYFHKTLNGFYCDGTIHPINSALDLLRFRPLKLHERIRLGVGSQICSFHRDWRRLDGVPVRDYLVRYCGRGAYEKFWTHLLRCKYDGSFDELPATAVWARIRRMSGEKRADGKKGGKKIGWDLLGYLKGGYQALVDRLSERIVAAGGSVHTGTPVRRLVVESGSVHGLETAEGFAPFDRVISTVAYPLLARMLPDGCAALRRRLEGHEYMGAICMLLMLRRRLSPYHCLYLLDPKIPFTGIIETTHYIDPAEVGGHHLVYLSKYFSNGSELQTMDEAAVREWFLDEFRRMFPDVGESDIAGTLFSRARYVDPVRKVGGLDSIPSLTGHGVEGLVLANNSQIYPRLPSGEAVVQYAGEVFDQLGVGTWAGEPAAQARAMRIAE